MKKIGLDMILQYSNSNDGTSQVLLGINKCEAKHKSILQRLIKVFTGIKKALNEAEYRNDNDGIGDDAIEFLSFDDIIFASIITVFAVVIYAIVWLHLN